VSIRLQEFPHWIFLSHCRLATSSANLRVTITTVRSQPCFNVVQNRGERRFSLTRSHPTIPLKKSYSQTKCAGHDEGCNQHFSTRASFKPIFALFLSKWISHLWRATHKCRQSYVLSLLYNLSRVRLRGGQRVQWPRDLCSKRTPRDDICLFQMKYSLKKLWFKRDRRIQTLSTDVALSIINDFFASLTFC